MGTSQPTHDFRCLALQHQHLAQIKFQTCSRTCDEFYDALSELLFLGGQFVDLGIARFDFGWNEGIFLLCLNWRWEGRAAVLRLYVSKSVADVPRALFLCLLLELWMRLERKSSVSEIRGGATMRHLSLWP